ncbi:hypothetical protein [Hymenobacter lapidiphilus]|uniref:Uncharacterized protein n=1 Tax=Hymenobacter lapidiphilus TaxID=2608003 RepID=A0A7Y7PL25_9BACT|nr:hypothetical protein [Hymenobacter lapidiphilus]NVO29781.1 hypothetical protein [Hymenobacter lapidiphilus]
MEARRETGWWYAALGAGAVSLAVIGVAYRQADAGYWLYHGPGWTIYPALSAFPQSIAPSGPDYISYLTYEALVWAAGLALAVGVVCWLVSLGRNRGPGALRPLRWLPLVLALPAAGHVGAYKYHLRQRYDPASHPLRSPTMSADLLESPEGSPQVPAGESGRD